MTNDLRDSLIQRHMQMAADIAGRFAASHPEVHKDDIEQSANVALIVAIDSYTPSESTPLAKHIACRVRGELGDMFDREGYRNGKSVKKRSSQLPATISLQIIGTAEGPPMNSILDLRSARSLNPRADIDSLTREAIGEIRQAAVIQNCPEHQEHEYYRWSAGLARDRVSQMRVRQSELAQRRKDAADDARLAA